ncbi:MAG: tRNA threonylcarbamoyladenosine dehydratase [Elusimicrobia bacterium]|nr:tRNA threonylcarbamoyladenosine dehydratase [Elusimicrobiota bacterium]
MDRFLRTELLLGKKALSVLRKSRVTIIGLGAVGSHCLESLARAGTGNFILADFDVIKKSNFNRNMLALEETVGKYKTEAAASRVLSINPSCGITLFNEMVDGSNIGEICSRSDVVLDAVDSLGPKAEILAYLAAHRIPSVSSMGAALRKDPSAVRSGDISQVLFCPLAQRLRKRLRKNGVTSGILCVYSEEKPAAASTAGQEEEYFKRGRERRILGSLPTVPAAFGATLASLALEILLNPKRIKR